MSDKLEEHWKFEKDTRKIKELFGNTRIFIENRARNRFSEPQNFDNRIEFEKKKNFRIFILFKFDSVIFELNRSDKLMFF